MRASISVAGDADRVEAGRQIVQRGAVPYGRIVQADGAGYGLRNIAPYPIKETANRGGLSCKHDNQRNSDQGVHASNRHAETKIGHDAFGLELDLLPVQCTFPTDCPAPKLASGLGRGRFTPAVAEVDWDSLYRARDCRFAPRSPRPAARVESALARQWHLEECSAALL